MPKTTAASKAITIVIIVPWELGTATQTVSEVAVPSASVLNSDSQTFHSLHLLSVELSLENMFKGQALHTVSCMGLPLDLTSSPGLHLVCETHVRHSSLEQWYPVLHLHGLRLVLFLLVLCSKFLFGSQYGCSLQRFLSVNACWYSPSWHGIQCGSKQPLWLDNILVPGPHILQHSPFFMYCVSGSHE